MFDLTVTIPCATIKSFNRCLILIEDCDRDEDGTAGRIGLDIIHRRYTELCVEDDPGETEED